MLVDAASDHPDEDREKLNRELREYSEDLTRKPIVVAMSRSDLRGGESRGGPPFPLEGAHWGGWISGVTGEGVDHLLTVIWDVLIGAGDGVPGKKEQPSW